MAQAGYAAVQRVLEPDTLVGATEALYRELLQHQ
jgi:hypothetical protein